MPILYREQCVKDRYINDLRKTYTTHNTSKISMLESSKGAKVESCLVLSSIDR